MISYSDWKKKQLQETGAAGGVFAPDAHIEGTWQGAPSGGRLKSVGDVLPPKKHRKHKKNK